MRNYRSFYFCRVCGVKILTEFNKRVKCDACINDNYLKKYIRVNAKRRKKKVDDEIFIIDKKIPYANSSCKYCGRIFKYMDGGVAPNFCREHRSEYARLNNIVRHTEEGLDDVNDIDLLYREDWTLQPFFLTDI